MGKSKRIFYYDVLRAIAIVGIVFCHASIPFILNGIQSPYFSIAAFFDCFREFSIPIFVMLSGTLLLTRHDTLIDFFKRRLSRLLIPFVFWAAISFIYSSIYIRHSFELSHAVDIFSGKAGTLGVAYWFIWMIIVAYIGIFVINKIIELGNVRTEGFDGKFITALTLISFIFIICSQFGLFSSFDHILFYFASFMSYVIIGYFIANNDLVGSRISTNLMISITLLASTGLYLYYIFGFVVPSSIAADHFVCKSYFNILILTLSVSVFSLFKYVAGTGFFSNLEHNCLGNALVTVSRYSFGIYLCHYLILFILRMRLFRYYHNPNPLIWIPVLVVLTVIISLAVLSIIERIPYLNRFSGKA